MTIYSHNSLSHPPTGQLSTVLHPTSIWLGGLPRGFVPPPSQVLPPNLYGCLFDFAYTSSTNRPLRLLDPMSSVSNRYVGIQQHLEPKSIVTKLWLVANTECSRKYNIHSACDVPREQDKIGHALCIHRKEGVWLARLRKVHSYMKSV